MILEQWVIYTNPVQLLSIWLPPFSPVDVIATEQQMAAENYFLDKEGGLLLISLLLLLMAATKIGSGRRLHFSRQIA